MSKTSRERKITCYNATDRSKYRTYTINRTNTGPIRNTKYEVIGARLPNNINGT